MVGGSGESKEEWGRAFTRREKGKSGLSQKRLNGQRLIRNDMERKQLNVLITSQKQPQPLYVKCVIRAKYNKDLPWLVATFKKNQIYFSFIGLAYLFFHACNQSFFPQFPVIVPILISIHTWHTIDSSLNTVQVLQSNLKTLTWTRLVEI